MRDVGGESLEKLLLVLAWANTAGFPAHLEPTAKPQQLFKAAMCVHTPAGQLTWQVTASQLPLVAHLPRSVRPHFDGATANQKLERLLALAGAPFASPGATERALSAFKPPLPMGPEVVAGWAARAELALKPKRPGRYDVYLSQNGQSLRVEASRGRRGLGNLLKDRAGRQVHPVNAWIYAGTITKR